MRKWIVRGTLVVAGVNLVFLFFAHAFFAVNAPTGAPVAVVEGWLEEATLAEAAPLVRDRQLVITTGTYRAFRHYMNAREVMHIDLGELPEGVPVIQVAGTVGAGFTLMNGADTIAHHLVTPQVVYYTCGPLLARDLHLISWNTAPHFDAATPNIFIRAFKVGGRNVNELDPVILHRTNDGRLRPGRTTEAAQAADLLVQHGVPAERIRAVPHSALPGSRTRTSALRVAEVLVAEGVDRVDVVTLGVHARRTRGLLRKAAKGRFEVGVISLPDPECPPRAWWRMRSGWIKVLKEVVGLRQTGTAIGDE